VSRKPSISSARIRAKSSASPWPWTVPNGAVNLGVPTFSLLSLHVESFPPDKLPADLAVIPAVKPGSK